MSDKSLMEKMQDYLIEQNRLLLDQALRNPTGPDALKSENAQLAAKVRELENELHDANGQITRLGPVRDDLEKTQRILNEERDENRALVATLREQLTNADQQIASQTEMIENQGRVVREQATALSERDAELANAEQRFADVEQKLQSAYDELAQLPPLNDSEREDLTRLVGQAVQFWEEDEDRALRSVTRALLTLQGQGGEPDVD